MKKNMKNIVMFLLFMVIFITGSEVSAEVYNGRLYELYHPNSGFTVFAEEDNRYMDYNSWMIKSTIDDRIYYCIDPAIPLEGALVGSHDYIVGKNNIINSSKITSAKYDKIEALAFYGYGYKDDKVDHTDKKWYGITQVMIWRVMRPDLNWTFKENRNAKPSKSLYSKEVKELDALSDEFKKTSSFEDKRYNVLLGKEIKVEDTNKVLSNFFVVNSLNKINLVKDGNFLTIKGVKQGTETIHFSRKIHTNSRYALLKSNNFQDIIVMGNGDLPFFNFKVTVTGGTFKLIKNDKDSEKNIPSGDASLLGAEYKIYDINDNLVSTIKTNSDGVASVVLDYGEYKIKESKAPSGYLLDDTVYNFKLDDKNTSVDLNVYDEVIKGELVINKTKGGSGEKYSPEEGAVFEIYDKENKLVSSVTTNSDGKASVMLPYGNYVIKQVKGNDGYVISDDREVSIRSSKVYEVNIRNKKLSVFELTKLDKSSNKPIVGTVFEIFDLDNNKLFEGSTNEKGKLVVYNLPVGSYYVKEKSASKYYKVSNDRYDFTIDDNGKVVKLKVFNEKVKGKLVFYKIDSLSGKRLSDAVIELIDKRTNKVLFEKVTDGNGFVGINNLEGGSYCVNEVKAPSGYRKSDKSLCFELEKENEVIELSMVNEKLVKVPNTYRNVSIIVLVVGFCFVCFSLTYFVYVKRK